MRERAINFKGSGAVKQTPYMSRLTLHSPQTLPLMAENPRSYQPFSERKKKIKL